MRRIVLKTIYQVQIRHYETLINQSILGMQSPEIFIAQNPQITLIEEIGRNSFRKNLALTVISGGAGIQCKLSLKIYEERQGKEKKCSKGSH